MEEVPEEEIEKYCDEVNYVQHHCVHKVDSTATKFTVVLDTFSESFNWSFLERRTDGSLYCST